MRQIFTKDSSNLKFVFWIWIQEDLYDRVKSVIQGFLKFCKLMKQNLRVSTVDGKKLKDNENESMWRGKGVKKISTGGQSETQRCCERAKQRKELLRRNKVTKWTLQMEKYIGEVFYTRIRQREGFYWCQKYYRKFWKKNIDKKYVKYER